MINKSCILGIVLIMGSLLTISSCSNAGAQGEADITCWIESVTESDGEIPGQILVNSPGNTTSDKFIVTVNDTADIFKDVEGKLQEVDFTSFSEGQQLDIWFSGAVAESCPAQVLAAKIVIKQDSASSDLPPIGDGDFAVNVEVSIDEFIGQNHITREIEITHPGELVVTLGSNQTTGFSWNENAIISDVDILTQIEHKVLGDSADEPLPNGEMSNVGSSAKEVWIFNSTKSGVTTLSFEYSRPWEGGEKAEWTFNLVVSVK